MEMGFSDFDWRIWSAKGALPFRLEVEHHHHVDYRQCPRAPARNWGNAIIEDLLSSSEARDRLGKQICSGFPTLSSLHHSIGKGLEKAK